jgi:hypothetical protein
VYNPVDTVGLRDWFRVTGKVLSNVLWQKQILDVLVAVAGLYQVAMNVILIFGGVNAGSGVEVRNNVKRGYLFVPKLSWLYLDELWWLSRDKTW